MHSARFGLRALEALEAAASTHAMAARRLRQSPSWMLAGMQESTFGRRALPRASNTRSNPVAEHVGLLVVDEIVVLAASTRAFRPRRRRSGT